MTDEIDNHSQSSVTSLEEMVNGAIGNSVTITRINYDPGMLRKRLGSQVEGPFDVYLDSKEQPHFLFVGASQLAFPDNKDPFDDDHHSSTIGGSIEVGRAALLVSNKRLILIYGNDESRRVISVGYKNINKISYSSGVTQHLTTAGFARVTSIEAETRKYRYSLSAVASYGSELKEATEYVKQKINADFSNRSHYYNEDNVSTIVDSLEEQLSGIRDIARRVDMEYVLNTALKGAKFGAIRGGYGAIVGGIVGAGYAIWSDITKGSEGSAGSENINWEKTARLMAQWQKAGEEVSGKRVGIAAAAVGTALEIDRQTSGRKISQILTDTDIRWISSQLADGNRAEVATKMATEVAEAYAIDLNGLLNDGLFEEITST